MSCQDRIDRLKTNTYTQEDINWAVTVLQKQIDYKRRKYINQKSKRVSSLVIPEPIVTNPDKTIRQRNKVSIVITKEYIFLVSCDEPIAIYSLNSNKYYTAKNTNSELNKQQQSDIINFLGDREFDHKLPKSDIFMRYTKLDLTDATIINYEDNQNEFWRYL